MNRKTVVLILSLICLLIGICYPIVIPTSLDFSKDEAPFLNMKMPPKLVRGDYYMDGGSVSVEIVDQTDHQYFITFPIYHHSVHTSHPTAYEGEMSDYTKPLKNPGRARAICIRLLEAHAAPGTDPAMIDYLSNPPDHLAQRIINKVSDIFR